MVRSLLLTFVMLISVSAVIAQSTVLTGKVTDDQGEALIGATIKVLSGSDFVRGTITDFNGDYRVQLDPGNYDVEVSYTGYQTQKLTGVRVLVNTINSVDYSMVSSNVLGEVTVSAFKVPLIEQDKTSTGQTLTSEQIKNLPTRSVNAIVATTAGTTSIDGGAINIKGSRSNATNYYIDGIRVSGTPPPVQDIEQLQVITGGLGAEYGDVTGGVISVITKGPASSFNGYVEVENSHGLDPYGWLLTTANVNGPLLKKKSADGTRERTLIGFRLSGQYLKQKDSGPPAVPVYHVKGDGLNLDNLYSSEQSVVDAELAKLEDPGNVRARLMAHPLTLVNGVVTPTAELYTQDSVDAMDYNPFNKRQDIDLTAKLDFRLTDNIDLSVTGTYKDVENQTGGGVLNAHNAPTNYSDRYRGIARFRHRLGNNDGAPSASRVSVSNASYTLQFGFERGSSEGYDPRHGNRLFDYGYIGRFNYNYVPITGTNIQGNIVHLDNRIEFTGFELGSVITNPGLLRYNEFANDEDVNTFEVINGRMSSLYTSIWSGMHGNVSLLSNSVTQGESDILTGLASASFDLKLGRTGTHNIQFGLLTEQRTDRSYAVAPFGLWNLMNLVTNNHFNGLDTNVIIGKYWDEIVSPILGDSITQYANAVIDLNDFKFYKSVRSLLGKDITEYVNPNELNPDQLSLSMFSPRELTDQGLIGYYGYDYLGNKLGTNIRFNDFFTSVDADGVRDFPVAPLRPLYQAAYVKDKFTFNKMIFSLGLRVERFDLNTKVLKDPYSMYEIISADEYFRTTPGAPARPGTIGDDFKVYVNSEQDPSLKAFRNGDTWYRADGTEVSDGNVIFGGGVVAPLLRDTTTGDDIFNVDFNPNTAFEDYTPQVNWMPRLAFSFPISEDANFFAHYDVLVQRPPSNWQVTPLDYIYFYVPGRTPDNNANLKPERVVDYEVGFQQRLNQNSALKFSAYYRELRDMIQSRTILYVPTIGRYDTYGNIDFGTVKGFTVQYDLRRIQNAELRLAYTLQFADGTGSNANSQRGLTTRGNIRTLSPLSFDERHNIQAILDYRFDSGKRYNGPRIGGKDILANFGANLQMSAASGRPYTSRLRPERFGGSGTLGAINGSRLPWRINLDLRVDKSFSLASAGKRPLNINVYLRVSNLLNKKNVVGVYSVTGSPTDDGYLATAEGQSVLRGIEEQNRNLDAYLAAYSWRLNTPGVYTLPRRIYVGASLAF
ncbi:MAG: carboxypeptidase regulatory-like domain-containing protein [Lewinellaceae bacterium]|nr:carboxypeptidase regulatory-like domain-containing protein [Saprospiraceae bacterium]MCB9315522.1 carboxypeptidase regulatory-like domain-containing protein [Lewinellaceae bacterium]MCB9331978.1 carboxypeptidase regulatory-like domain-containing protein [Lewinellaceae bacterium]